MKNLTRYCAISNVYMRRYKANQNVNHDQKFGDPENYREWTIEYRFENVKQHKMSLIYYK